MLRVVYSNQLERLVAPLAESLAAERESPLDRAVVVVPNGHVAQYLKLGIARRGGIAAQLELPFLERFLASLAPEGTAPLDRTRLLSLLCSALDDTDALAGDRMAPVRAYLEAADPRERGADAEPDSLDERALRGVQLAGQLATLFGEYALSRPELLDAWAADRPAELPPRLAATEAWQRALWRAVFGPAGALERVRERTGVRWLPLPALFSTVDPRALSLPRRVHVFGFSYVARAFYRILERLAGACDLVIYALNPCREFWEDVSPLEKDEDTPALRLWGSAGRDHTAALNSLTGADFADGFADPAEGRTDALALLQRDILRREPARVGERRVSVSESRVRLLACAGVRREAEAIADEIWSLIQADDTLRFSDIAVYVNRAQRDAYQTHLAAALRAAGNIPHTVSDVPLTRDSRIVDAVELLLELPFGSFSRRELLRLVTHPAVTARYPDVDLEQWLRWADRLAIVHGADRHDHAGTYIEGDRFNWDQGVKRLALGAFMAGERSGDDRAFDLGGAAYLPEEAGPDQGVGAARFGLLVRSLIADARFCRAASVPLAAWATLATQLVATYLHPVGDDDERELDQVLAAVAGLRELDLDGRPVRYRVARELIRAALGGLRTSRGEFLTEGVAVSTLAPMRVVPFRYVFAAGLGEGSFPQIERDSPLDLRTAHRQRGDVTARDRDRYLFLELVLAARDGLYVSYVARDEQTGDERQPCAVALELRDLLAAGYLAERDPGALVRRQPLRRYQRPGVAPEARREARSVALREHLREHLGGAALPSLSALREALPADRWARLEHLLALPPAPVPAVRDPDEPLALSLYVLREFLASPLQASAGFLLGLRRDEDDDVFERDDEPFEVAALAKAQLLRESFLESLGAEARGEPADLVGRYGRRAARLALEGVAPTGVFAAVERDRHLALLKRWREQLGTPPGPYRVWRFGRAHERSRVDELLPPLPLLLPDGTRVELYGKTEPVCVDPPASLTLSWSKFPDRYQLRGYLDHAVLAAAELLPPAPFSAAVTGPDGLLTRGFPALEPAAAQAWLAALISDFLTGVHDYLLPCELVIKFVESGRERPFAALLADALGREQPGISCAWGPVRDYAAFSAPADPDALIERRFGRFFGGAR